MKSPEELRQKLARQWENADLREGRLLDREESWPVILPIGKPKAEVVRHETALVREQVRSWSKVALGEVIWKEDRYRATLDPVRYPAQWVIRSVEEWVGAANDRTVTREYENLQRLLGESDELFHSLLVRRRSLWRGREVSELVACLRMAAEICPGCADGLPLRALPLAGNDTKFLERNEGVLLALLDVRFEGEASEQGLESFLGAASDRGHWLLIVDLGGGLLPFEQIRLRASELTSTGLPGSHLLVVENESCLHQLPRLPGTMAVLGTGFDLSWLSGGWLKEKQVAYWGDLDTWGLELLGRARDRVPDLRALLMTEEVFSANEKQAVVEAVPMGGAVRESLTEEEAGLLEKLKGKERGRLEQEFLSEKLVRSTLKEWREEAGPSGEWKFSARQGQFLAFIHRYCELHGRAPAEAEIQDFFEISPPSVNSMVKRLHEKGLISRVPGQARSIKVLVPPGVLPELA
jgi:hypothetical protein